MRFGSSAIVLGSVLAVGCSPNPPTDGFFGCASVGRRCPAAFPYCDPTDDRCRAREPADAGMREYASCSGPVECPGPLECVQGACVTPCSGVCPDGRLCARALVDDATSACVPSCDPGRPDCSPHPSTRPRILSRGVRCECAPDAWPPRE